MNFRKWVSCQLISNKLLSARPFQFSDEDSTSEEHVHPGINKIIELNQLFVFSKHYFLFVDYYGSYSFFA